ncbi:MAG: metal-dependent transcriptional regulator [Bacilli bacterium]|nr:metal-dependent transcriptional regulator [Bacilli bacterium]
MELFESAQDYLERILMLEEERGEGKVRAIDVANSLGFSRASVSIAMHRLEESGFLRFGDSKELLLTASGREEAVRIYERHQVLTKTFICLGVDPEVAKEDACKVEHDISEETFQALKKYINK